MDKVKIIMVKGEKGDAGVSGDYATIANKPRINGVELSGNKTGADLSLVGETEMQTIRDTIDADKAELQSNIDAVDSAVDTHVASRSNPHVVTKAQVGLGNVENKSSATIRGELTASNITSALSSTPLPIDNGGTGATSATSARNNLGLGSVENKSSAMIRAEITAQNVTNALASTPLPVANGGTGATTLDDAGIVTKTGAQAIIGVKTMATGLGVYHNSGSPALRFLRNRNAEITDVLAWIFANTTTVNNKNVMSRLYLREYSYDSATGDQGEKFENYSLPTVDADRSDNGQYVILTTKNLVAINQGGTGASTASGACENIGAVKKTLTSNSPSQAYFTYKISTYDGVVKMINITSAKQAISAGATCILGSVSQIYRPTDDIEATVWISGTVSARLLINATSGQIILRAFSGALSQGALGCVFTYI